MSLNDYKTALVTGASSGIGWAVTRTLAAKGLIVHAAARRKERLEALARETSCIIHEVDVRDRTAVTSAFDSLEIDILVNGAGMGHDGVGLHNLAPEQIDAVLETNVLGTARVLRAVLPGMVSRKRGHIINLGSIAGHHAFPYAIYGASKAAIHMLSQNLRLELQGTGIRVSEICPGTTKTEFHAVGHGRDQGEIDKTWYDFNILTADDVADAIAYVLDAPARVDVTLLELMSTEQALGGGAVVPENKAD